MREAAKDYEQDLQSCFWDYGAVISSAADELEELQKACKDWSEVSQRNFQLAKRYEQALRKIADPRYGLQGIQEDYHVDDLAHTQAILEYYKSLYYHCQQVARKELEK